MNYEEIYDIINEHLKTKTPISITRLGDGEALLLNTTETITPNPLNRWLKKQFNYVMDRKLVLEIKQLVMEGYDKSDIIGVPTQKHRDTGGQYWRDAEDKLIELVPSTKNKPKASIDLHTDLLQSGLLDKLLYAQDELIYLSCRHLDKELESKYNLKVTSKHVTPQQKFEFNRIQSKYYPDDYKDVVKFIKKVDCKGKLCLVGTGMLGKYYTSLLKEHGGIAVDIGHVFDKWAGMITRGQGKGLGKTDNTYKL